MEDHPAGEIRIEQEQNGTTRVDLVIEDRAVSRLWIIPFHLRIGAATVRMDGIGGVGTEEEYRRRGYSRRVLEATVEHMRRGDAALSMLYGIPDFYPKFGYATAGPEHLLALPRSEQDAALPSGWSVRPFTAGDLPAVRAIYDTCTRGSSGTAVRDPEARSWKRLLASPTSDRADECRVIQSPDGRVAAYAWRSRGHWSVNTCEKNHPDALVLGEVMADSLAAAHAILSACQSWATEPQPPSPNAQRPTPLERILLFWPPEGPVAAAARCRAARFEQRYSPCGGSMARVLNTGRLLHSLAPELTARLRASGETFRGTIRFETETGTATLRIGDAEVTLAEESHQPDLTLRLPQSELARLALGAWSWSAEGAGERGEERGERGEERGESGRAGAHPNAERRTPNADHPSPNAELLQALFPLRHPHMHLPDRY